MDFPILRPFILLAVLSGYPAGQTLQAQPENNNQPTPAAPVDEGTLNIEQTLPLFESLELPSREALLNGEKIDWIVLIGGKVIQTPAIYPRPDHQQWLLNKQKYMQDDRPTDAALLEEWLAKYHFYDYIFLTIDDKTAEEEFRLHTRYISEILYHEELCLRKTDTFLAAGDLLHAQELIAYVKRQEFLNNERRVKERLEPIEWPGLMDRERAFMAAEVRAALAESNPEKAFSIIRRRFDLDPKDPQHEKLLTATLELLASQCYEKYDYRRLRHYLVQTELLLPKLPAIKQWRDDLGRRADQSLKEAEQNYRNKQFRNASLLAQQAILIWPFSSQLLRQSQQFQEPYQILTVGVTRDESIETSLRHTIRDHQWFTIQRLATGYPRIESPFLESWIPEDLGLKIQIQFALQPRPHEARPSLNAIQFSQLLKQKTVLAPDASLDLFAQNITSVRVLSPALLEVELSQQTPHPLNLLAAVMRAYPGESQSLLQDQHFPLASPSTLPFESPGEHFVRVDFNPQKGARNVAEVHLREFELEEELLRSVLRDELLYLPETPHRYLNRLRSDQRFLTANYATPRVSSLAFRLEGQLAEHPELRLALFSMIDREQIAQELRQYTASTTSLTSITESICPSSSHARMATSYATSFDELAGRALYEIIRHKPGFPTAITFRVPPTRSGRFIAEIISKQWQKLGLTISIVHEDPSAEQIATDPSQAVDVELLEYVIAAPQFELPALLMQGKPFTVARLASLPTYLRSTLLDLEHAPTWESTDNALLRLQDQLVANSWWLPLVEQQRFATYRREVRGVPAIQIDPLSELDEWSLEPVVPQY
ncbi:MAG: hypothetical protein KDA78_10780 [Planctomycetaceae bacterium]|nr:hypothetical protein [Planctomycetaceae bacterium]